MNNAKRVGHEYKKIRFVELPSHIDGPHHDVYVDADDYIKLPQRTPTVKTDKPLTASPRPTPPPRRSNPSPVYNTPSSIKSNQGESRPQPKPRRITKPQTQPVADDGIYEGAYEGILFGYEATLNML